MSLEGEEDVVAGFNFYALGWLFGEGCIWMGVHVLVVGMEWDMDVKGWESGMNGKVFKFIGCG